MTLEILSPKQMTSISGAIRNFLTLSEKFAIVKESDSSHGSKVELAKII